MDRSPFGQDWLDTVDQQVGDPLLASLICKLARHVNSVLSTKKSKDWRGHFQAVLEVCRTSQHIRLYVGDMHGMELAARGFVGEALQVAVESFADPTYIDPANREEFVQATGNIRYRLNLTSEDQAA